MATAIQSLVTATKKALAWLRRELLAIYLAIRCRAMPLWGRILALIVVAYALSPIDLIPDVIPVLGVLDDLLLLPPVVWLLRKMIPAIILADCRRRAEDGVTVRRRVLWAGAIMVLLLWLLLVVLAGVVFWRHVL